MKFLLLFVAIIIFSEIANSADGSTFSRQEVCATQQRLLDLGYNPGPVDGVMGGKTRNALKKFQADKGIVSSGILNTDTREALGVKSLVMTAPSFVVYAERNPATGKLEQKNVVLPCRFLLGR